MVWQLAECSWRVSSRPYANVAGVMGLMSVWVGGLSKPCTGQFGASAMSAMSAPTAEHQLKNGELLVVIISTP